MAALVVAATPVRADIFRTGTSVTFTGAITTASTGLVTVAATLWTDPAAPGTLNLALQNTSASTIDPAGLLTAFYFGVYSGGTSGTAPALTYLSGTGQVYKPLKDSADVAGVWIPPSVTLASGTFLSGAPGLSNLMAIGTGDQTWQFKTNLSLVASEPPLNFGIGTVGGTRLGSNGFNGSIVDGNDFGIYAGDVTTQSVASQGLLVGGTAVFRFGNFTGYTVANIPNHAVFGLGSGPDLIITVPEPGTVALAAAGLAAVLCLRARRRSVRLRAALGSTATAVAAGLVIVALLFAVPARAAPDAVPVADWDFMTSGSGLGWTSQTFKTGWVAVTGTRYDYWMPPTVSAPSWHVDLAKQPPYPPAWFVNTLTSPVITVPEDVDLLEFSIRHRFDFPTNIRTLDPIVVGQVAWRYYDPAHLDAPFQPFAPATFATGPVPPPFNALSPDPNWVPNNYTVGTFRVPPLLAGGGAWVGESPGWATGDYVMSQVFLDGGLSAGEQVQFRFMNAILDVGCTGSRWDVARVTVIGQLPEPGGLALAAAGAGSAAIALVARKRRARLTSGPRARA